MSETSKRVLTGLGWCGDDCGTLAREVEALESLIHERSGLDDHHPSYSPEWALTQMADGWASESARVEALEAKRSDEAHAIIADLRDRLRVLAPMVCEGCGCAPIGTSHPYLCGDCELATPIRLAHYRETELLGACVVVGLRALCGRKLCDR